MKLPKRWDEVTIEKFVKSHKIDTKELDGKISLLSIMSSEPEDKLYELSLPNLINACNSLSFLSEEIPVNLILDFRLNGIRFNANTSVKALTGSGFIDLTNYAKTQEDVINNLHKILALFCKPVKNWFGKKVTMTKDQVSDFLYKNMPITIANSLAVFFCELLKNFLETTKIYLDKQLLKAMRMMDKALKKDGDGLSPSTT